MMLTENGRKNTAAKQPSSWGASCGYHISESHVTTAQQIRRPSAPGFVDAHIQLAGAFPADNHRMKLLSGLRVQTHSRKNIASAISSVNPESFF